MITGITRMSRAWHGDKCHCSIPSLPGLCVTLRHPGHGSQRETRAGIQKESDHTLNLSGFRISSTIGGLVRNDGFGKL
jgi:hypothetical protein